MGSSISSPTEPWTWDWSYQALSPIAEIDLDLDDGGPGSTNTAAIHDPIMADLGWQRKARVGSSPGSGIDAPQSVNFAYVPDFEELSIGDLTATPVVAKAWADEELNFGRGPDGPGYRIDLEATLAPGLIPVPTLATLIGNLPSVADATLTRVILRSRERSPDSFDADFGLHYIEVQLEFDLPNGSADTAYEAYSTGLDGEIYHVGSEDMLTPGTIRPSDPYVYNDTWSQDVVVLGRYPGLIKVIADQVTGDAEASVRITLDPNREELVPQGGHAFGCLGLGQPVSTLTTPSQPKPSMSIDHSRKPLLKWATASSPLNAVVEPTKNRLPGTHHNCGSLSTPRSMKSGNTSGTPSTRSPSVALNPLPPPSGNGGPDSKLSASNMSGQT